MVLPWFERCFTFDLPVTAAPGLVERLRGTPVRLRERVAGLPAARLVAKRGDRWSIQENVGYLWDLEPLWMTRVEDIAGGKAVLEVADLQNPRTHDANRNARPVAELLNGFVIGKVTCPQKRVPPGGHKHRLDPSCPFLR